MLPDSGDDLLDDLRRGIGVLVGIEGEEAGHDAVPPRRPPNRSLVWPGGRHPDRYTGLLRGRRTKGDLLEPIVLALEREGLTGPQPGQDPETLVEHLTSDRKSTRLNSS